MLSVTEHSRLSRRLPRCAKYAAGVGGLTAVGGSSGRGMSIVTGTSVMSCNPSRSNARATSANAAKRRCGCRPLSLIYLAGWW